jgi:hypothetical protein
MYLEIVMVCVDYSDFLAFTLPQAKMNSDYLVVVTTPADQKTQKLCQYYNVECVVTNAFYEDGDSFNKAKGINAGMKYLSKRDWVLHMDADIYLPSMTKNILQKKDLNKHKIYGVDRLMCPDYKSWMNYISKPEPIHDAWIFIHLNAFPIASRVADYNGDGYSPIGYFQLWNPNVSGIKCYPEQHGAADRTDMLFAKGWDKSLRELIPEVVAIHLDSENATVNNMGKNWSGRKTKPFSYLPPKKTTNKRVILWMALGLSLGSAVTWLANNWQFVLSMLGY